MKNLISLTLLTYFCCTSASLSHEVWLDADEFQVETSETLTAELKNGQNFVGSGLIYNPRSFTRFEVLSTDGLKPVSGTIGDRPALGLSGQPAGLQVIGYESTVSTLTYKEWEKFQAFADHKDFTDIKTRHDARGLPETDFVEAYTRHVKMLACVGSCDGQDAIMGLETELVALANPYQLAPNTPLRVQLLLNGAPQPDRQIEIFARAADETVQITTTRTNENGVADIMLQPDTTYLLDAVTLRVPSTERHVKTNAVWDTLWAALTFQTPE